jgi:ribosome maturation factor RimP
MKLSENTKEAIRAAAADQGCRLLEIESAGAGRFSVLRVVLERNGGGSVTLEDCEAVSREISTLLDQTDEIRHRYSLEVSSAGLERKLYSVEDAARFVGRTRGSRGASARRESALSKFLRNAPVGRGRHSPRR